MVKYFKIAEILESVDSINHYNRYNLHERKKITERSKKFINKKIDMKDNRDTEKIILDAEKSIEQNDVEKIDDQNHSDGEEDTFKIDIKSKMERVIAQKESILNAIKSGEKKLANKEEINLSDTDSSQSLTSVDNTNPLILENELTKEEEVLEEEEEIVEEEEEIVEKEEEIVEKEEEIVEEEEEIAGEEEITEEELITDDNRENDLGKLEEENNLKSLENNFVYINEKIKFENIKKEEKIKDQNILLNKFLSQERYSDLDKKIKLYQEDNAILRKNILKLSDQETKLRLRLSDVDLSKQISVDQNEKFEQSSKVEREDIKKLNIKIENLLQKNNQLETKLSELQKTRENQSIDVDQKIKFYREENAKIIIDKSDIQRKLENTKNQLLVNEGNKRELKLALDNLNQILAASNIEANAFKDKTFNNKNEKFENNVKKERIHKTSENKLDESSLDYLVKEIFSK